MPSASTNSHPLTLLATVAHPDDETFGIGGTLALYARRGVAVHVICATNGEEGTVTPEDLGTYSSVAALRTEKELPCAAETLGVAGLHLLGYRDSGMAGSESNQNPDSLTQAPLEEVATRIAVYIRQIRPQVMITHDPMGGYLHPDHIATHKATVRAFEMAADPGLSLEGLPPHQTDKLYYNTFPKRMFRILIRLAPLFRMNPRKFGRNKDIDLVALAGEVAYPINAVVDFRNVVEVRNLAAECHHSQLASGPPSSTLMNLVTRLTGNKDWYTRAYPADQTKSREKDLFQGVL
ncbi:MAG TPA: PIG-L deacetylase family protein [Anaerolineales bacterium]|nr:PIG-L deacetylase family protein [Anaerolineales bacterium]